MDFFKKKSKTKEFVLQHVKNQTFDEMYSLVPSLKKENEYALMGFDEAINELLQDESNHSKIADFFLFLMNSNSPSFFKLYYDSLLFNPTLYQILIKEQGYKSENHFDHYLMFQAEDFKENEAKTYALSVLSMLKDSFLAKDKMKKKFD